MLKHVVFTVSPVSRTSRTNQKPVAIYSRGFGASLTGWFWSNQRSNFFGDPPILGTYDGQRLGRSVTIRGMILQTFTAYSKNLSKGKKCCMTSNDPRRCKKMQEDARRCKKIQEDPRRSKKIQEDPRRSKKIQEDPRRSKKIQEDPRRSKKIQEDPRRSKKIQEDPRRSKKIQEDPRRSKKIQEDPRFFLAMTCLIWLFRGVLYIMTIYWCLSARWGSLDCSKGATPLPPPSASSSGLGIASSRCSGQRLDPNRCQTECQNECLKRCQRDCQNRCQSQECQEDGTLW